MTLLAHSPLLGVKEALGALGARPATSFAPDSHASFSNFCVHLSRLSKRIFMVPWE